MKLTPDRLQRVRRYRRVAVAAWLVALACTFSVELGWTVKTPVFPLVCALLVFFAALIATGAEFVRALKD